MRTKPGWSPFGENFRLTGRPVTTRLRAAAGRQGDEDGQGKHVPPVRHRHGLVGHRPPERHRRGRDVPDEVCREPPRRSGEDELDGGRPAAAGPDDTEPGDGPCQGEHDYHPQRVGVRPWRAVSQDVAAELGRQVIQVDQPRAGQHRQAEPEVGQRTAPPGEAAEYDQCGGHMSGLVEQAAHGEVHAVPPAHQVGGEDVAGEDGASQAVRGQCADSPVRAIQDSCHRTRINPRTRRHAPSIAGPARTAGYPPSRLVNPGGMTRSSGDSSLIDEWPRPRRQASMPDRIRSSTFSTPAWPFAARPHRYARPIITALAPRASAFTTSPPRRTPPSSSTSTWSPTARAISGSIRMVAGVPSRLLPPWLDTEIAETPASTARLASSTRVMPLTMNGPSHCERSQATSSQVAGAVCIHCP